MAAATTGTGGVRSRQPEQAPANVAGEAAPEPSGPAQSAPPTRRGRRVAAGYALSRLDDERGQIAADIERYYNQLPAVLKSDPQAQEECLEKLLAAERILANPELTREDIIDARQAVTRVAINFARLESARFSYTLVLGIIYVGGIVGGGLGFLGYRFGWFSPGATDLYFLSVPFPVWLWALIGSFTSMLFRAGHLPFNDRAEAIRWALFRPVVGVVMGVLAYLLLRAGLIVFTGGQDTQTPELVWVIAFVGAFSDTLSVNLLQRVIGNVALDTTMAREPEDASAAGEPTGSRPR